MNIKPLTKEQQCFAEENHHLVYAFLNSKRLPESLYYDVVIFAYLCAVQEYCETPDLHRYKFSSLAWKKMQSAVADYQRYLQCQRRAIPVISLDELISNQEELHWEETISRPDELMTQLETELILHALAKKLPRRNMRIICMKLRGDRMHDIAKKERMTFQQINAVLEDSYPTVTRVLWG